MTNLSQVTTVVPSHVAPVPSPSLRQLLWLPQGMSGEGTGISSNLVLELLHGLGAQWSPVGEGVPEMTRLEKIPWEGEFTLRSDS